MISGSDPIPLVSWLPDQTREIAVILLFWVFMVFVGLSKHDDDSEILLGKVYWRISKFHLTLIFATVLLALVGHYFGPQFAHWGIPFVNAGGLIGAMYALLTMILLRRPLTLEERTRPNVGIRKSIKNAIVIPLMFVLLTTVLFGIEGTVIGAFAGFYLAYFFGLFAVQLHITLRLLLWLDGSMPFGLPHFLDYADRRLKLVRRNSGSYVFFHPMLIRRYFAELESARLHLKDLPCPRRKLWRL